jgi:hypothetical protein
MSRSAHSGRGFHRWRAARIIVFVIPTVLCASALKLARASFYDAPMFCDGVDDETAARILCALPEEPAKKLSSMKARPNPSGKVSCPAISRPRVTPAGVPLLITPSESPLRLKGLLALRAGSSEDPDGPH